MRNGQDRDISVIVPVYNEEKYVGRVIEDLLDLDLFREIILVEDGSTDRTLSELEYFKGHETLQILHNERNMGKGYAVSRGLKLVTAPYVVLQDGDLEYPVENLIEIVSHLGYDMVAGVRMIKEAAIQKMTVRSFLINKMFIKLLGSPDVFTGQRMLNARFMRALNLKSRGFQLETELTVKAIKLGAKVKYVPIGYNARTASEGKKIGPLDLFKISLAYLTLKINLF